MRKYIQILLFFTTINIYAQTGNVGVGTNTPNASAILDINSANKGVLFPNVALTAANAASPLTSPATGLIVWNTGTGGLAPAGYYYNSGTAATPSWTKVAEGAVLTTSLTNGKILIGNASNIAAEQTLSGDVTITNTGVATIQDNSVDGTDIALGSDATGDLMYYNGTDWVRLAAGTTGQLLQANGAAAPSWSARTAILNSQNGLSTVTTGGSATATTPYVELGGTLYKATTITQGANTLAFTATANNGFSVDGTTFSVDAATDKVGIGTTAPSIKLEVANNATDILKIQSTTGGAGNKAYLDFLTYAHATAVSARIGGLDMGSNNGGLVFEVGNAGSASTVTTEAMRITNTGNVGIGTTNINAKLDVAGILAMNDYAIRLRPGTDANHQIIFNSTVDGPSIEGCTGIQFKKNCTAEVLGVWKTDALDIQNSSLWAREGLKTKKSYRYYQRYRGYNTSGTDGLGEWDFCALAGSTYYIDASTDFDQDIQCNLYPSSEGGTGYGDGVNYDASFSKAYTARPTWTLYSENLDGGSRLTCAAMCINFE